MLLGRVLIASRCCATAFRPALRALRPAKLSTTMAEMIDLTQDSPPQKKRRTEATPSGALVHTLARTHNVQEHTIGAVRRLLVDEQRTVPFVARYRAQETQQLPPDALRAILDALHGAAALEAKRQKVLEAMRSANASPEALSAARRAGTLRALDDAYAPFKGPAKCSKAAKAREDFPASDRIVASLLGRGEEPRHLHPKQKECVLLVLADAVAKDPRARQATQRRFVRGTLSSKKGKEPNAEYRFYEGWSRPLRRVAGHAWLALERASKAKALSITIDPGGDDKEAVRDLAQCLGLRNSKFAAPALKDAWTRLLKPRGRREVKRDGLIRAKDEAIMCFAANVKKLLEQAPPLIDDGSVLAVDPGFRHGHKCCVVSGRDGSLQTHFTVDAPGAEDDMRHASTRLDSLVGDHTITCVAIGDGTNTRGAQRLVASTPKLATVPRAVVRECGASVYSASDSAAKEFGENVPLSARGAASLARRLLDPLGSFPCGNQAVPLHAVEQSHTQAST